MIDFILTSYNNTEYITLALESLEKFTKSPFRVTIIENSTDIDRFKKIYKDKDNYQILKGPQNGVWKKPGDGSKNHSAGLSLGMQNTDNPIVCFLDSDILFLDTWEDEILPLLETNFLVSNRYEKGICRPMFMIFKRKNFEKYDLLPDASWVDTCGNITKCAVENDENLVILGNTAFNMNGEFIGDKSKHLLNLPHGEQCSVNGKPFFFHYGRGETRPQEKIEMWNKEARRYLDCYKQTSIQEN